MKKTKRKLKAMLERYTSKFAMLQSKRAGIADPAGTERLEKEVEQLRDEIIEYAGIN